jgi:N-carbamoylputrescine amidase
MCTEMWFFEWARHFGAQGADVLATPRATGRGSIDK